MNRLSAKESSLSRKLDAQKDGFRMQFLQSNADIFLFGIPMVAALLVAMFRLDELACRSRKLPKHGRKLSNWDEDGVPICTDPVRTILTVRRKKY